MNVLITIVSSNINEVMKTTLNLFIQILTILPYSNAYNAPKKYLWENSHLFAYLRFCAFSQVFLRRLVLLVLLMLFSAFSAFSAFCAFSACEIFLQKKIKSLKLPS